MNTNPRLSKRIMPILLSIGIPASLQNISEYLQQVIDTIYIGQYSTQSLVAVSTAIMPIITVESIWIGMFLAITIIVAQYLGAKKLTEATKFIQASFVLGAIFAVGFFIFWNTMATTIFKMMNLNEATATEAAVYIQTLSFSYPFRFIGKHVPAAILLAQGRSNILMWATFAQTLTNIIVNPLFIWGIDGFIPELGLRGAAIGTVCAEIVAIIIISTYFWKHDKFNLKSASLLPIKFDMLIRIKNGIPITIEIMIWALANSLVIAMLNKSLDNGGAIFNIAFLLSDICYRILHGFDVANTSLVGRSFGAKRKDQLLTSISVALRTKLTVGFTIFTLLYVFQKPFVGLFSNDPQITNIIIDNFAWILTISLAGITVGLNMSTLNGMGYSRYSLYISAICIPLRVVIAWFVIRYTNWGLGGVLAATVVEEGIRLVATYWCRQYLVKKYINIWTHPIPKNSPA